MTIDSRDTETLEALRKAGADLTKETKVNFYLYLATKGAAEQAAAALGKQSYQTEVRPPLPGYDTWLCFATRRMAPSAEAIERTRATFESLAAGLGGEFDGWEAAVAR